MELKTKRSPILTIYGIVIDCPNVDSEFIYKESF